MTINVLDCSGVGGGGISRVLTELVRHWPAAETLDLIAVPDGWEVPTDTGTTVHVTSRQTGGRERTITAAAAALRRATGEPASATRVLSLSPSLAIVGSRLPVTTIVHDLAFRLWPHGLSKAVLQYRRVSYATAISRSAHLFCVSARTQHDLFGHYDVARGRTTVWQPGSDLVVPGTLPPALEAVRNTGDGYLLVAGHAAHKGVELAIEAIAALPRHTLAVLTGGNRIAAYEQAADTYGVRDRIVFLDRLAESEYAAALAHATAFLMPSHFEGFGLPAAEALQLGTPTVISPDPALHEATGGAAIRMASWTAAALVHAVAEVRSFRPPDSIPPRTWAVATRELVDRLATLHGTPQVGNVAAGH